MSEHRDERLSDTNAASTSGAQSQPPPTVRHRSREVHYRPFVLPLDGVDDGNPLSPAVLTDERHEVTCRWCRALLTVTT